MFRVPAVVRDILFVLLAGCVLWLVPPPAGAAAPAPPKDLITFSWSLSPEDPFSKENAVGITPKEFKRGETFFLTVTGTLEPGYHTYPLTKRTQYQAESGLTKVIHSDEAFKPLWPVSESEPEFFDEGSEGIYLEHERPFTWTQEFLVKPDAKPGPQTLRLVIDTQACDISHCTPVKKTLDIPVTVAETKAVALTPGLEKRQNEKAPPAEVIPVPPGVTPKKHAAPPTKPDQTPDDQEDTESEDAVATFRGKSFARFALEGVGWGLLSLLTPCVFPMIPITVSFFLKQSEQKHSSPLTLATVYCGTIVAVLLVGGLTIVSVLQPVSQHYLTNLVLGLLFLFFALSLFGMYEIVLPSGLANFTATREGRGGVAGTFFMALTFTIISFACVAPFYGGFLIFSAASVSPTAEDFTKLFAGALAYSVAFAAPFFVLALFPSLLKTLPRSGSWMNTLKVVMGFIEVAAALKFLRGAELVYFHSTSILTFDLVLGMYVALAVACGLYLLGLFRLPHDYEAPQMLGVPRLLFSLAFISLGLYLLPGLFKQGDDQRQRPRGEVFGWIESFLLPDNPPAKPQAAKADRGQPQPSAELAWGGELKSALQEARDKRKYIFIDFTGHN
jgi:thiol:disulfide interchange protein